jgi:hypothetical protein
MKKIIIILIIFLNSCSIIPHHKSGYVITKDGRKYEIKEGNIFINQCEIHFDTITIYKKDIKEIHLEY